jgi:hypothetical protein
MDLLYGDEEIRLCTQSGYPRFTKSNHALFATVIFSALVNRVCHQSLIVISYDLSGFP